MSRKIWNQLAKDFESAVLDVTTSSGAQLVELVRRTAPSRQKTLIDAGCGIGSFVKRFGRRFGHVVAFDFAAKMVTRAKQRCPSAREATWLTLGLEHAATKIGPVGNLVACLNVITSTDADLRCRQWVSLAGLVRPGGHALVVVPSLESALRVAKFADDDNKIHASDFDSGLVYRGQYVQKHYARAELQAIVRNEGLRPIALKRIHYPWSDDGVDDPGRTPPWSWVVLGRKLSRRTAIGIG